MKVLVLGQNSYICSCLIDFSKKYNFEVDSIGVRDGEWKNSNFSMYDTILCPIGIAHVSTDPKLESKYYEVNRDLPVLIAKKAKEEGVNQFIFFSSMIVYGKDLPLGSQFIINEDTILNPENFYGKSKLEAEQLLSELEDENFNVARVRIPMVYGPNCKGNFPKLLKIAEKLSFCPNIDNKRSMIYIDNLCEFFCRLIISGKGGLYHPQNTEYVSTKEIIQKAAFYFNHKIIFTNIFNPMLKMASKKIDVINRIFGTKVYDKKLSVNIDNYNIINFDDSIKYCVDSYKNKL